MFAGERPARSASAATTEYHGRGIERPRATSAYGPQSPRGRPEAHGGGASEDGAATCRGPTAPYLRARSVEEGLVHHRVVAGQIIARHHGRTTCAGQHQERARLGRTEGHDFVGSDGENRRRSRGCRGRRSAAAWEGCLHQERPVTRRTLSAAARPARLSRLHGPRMSTRQRWEVETSRVPDGVTCATEVLLICGSRAGLHGTMMGRRGRRAEVGESLRMDGWVSRAVARRQPYPEQMRGELGPAS